MKNYIVTLLLLPLVFGGGSLFAKKVPEKFRYEIYTSNALRWKNGDGPPQDTQNKMADALESAIKKSRKSIDFCIYGIANQSWFLKILGQKSRSLDIRAVVDQRRGKPNWWSNDEVFTYKDTPLLVKALGENQVKTDVGKTGNAPGSIMHNKFAIFDDNKVFYGSTNISSTGIGDEYNANMNLMIHSKAFAKLYKREFDQMFQKELFGGQKQSYPMDTQVLKYKDGTKVEVFFSPQDAPLETAVLPFIKSAKKSLDIAMYFLTERRAADALIAAHRRGVKVRIIQDATSAHQATSQHRYIREESRKKSINARPSIAGINVRIENWGGKMHMKTAIADKKRLLIGSMNWSNNGSKENDENTTIIHHRKLAKDATLYFNQLWESLSFYDDWDPYNLRDPRPESPFSKNSCFDGFDNNYKDGADKADKGCSTIYYPKKNENNKSAP